MLVVGWRAPFLCRALSPVETPTIRAAQAKKLDYLVLLTTPGQKREVNSIEGKAKLAHEVDLPGAVPPHLLENGVAQ